MQIVLKTNISYHSGRMTPKNMIGVLGNDSALRLYWAGDNLG